MDVNRSKTRHLGDGHSIEVGGSTWDANETSIRNRYSTVKGGYNVAASSELPIEDTFLLVKTALEEDLYPPARLAELIGTISGSLKRQTK
jgi:hypothetical protein